MLILFRYRRSRVRFLPRCLCCRSAARIPYAGLGKSLTFNPRTVEITPTAPLVTPSRTQKNLGSWVWVSVQILVAVPSVGDRSPSEVNVRNRIVRREEEPA